MFYPLLGMTAALWLIVAPFFGFETGLRADLSWAAGILCVGLSFASIWRFAAGVGMAVIGAILWAANLLVEGSFAGVASYAVCAAALVVAGMSPRVASTTEPVSTGTHPVNTRLSHEPPSSRQGAAR